MNNVIIDSECVRLKKFYTELFEKIIEDEKRILYVGYEEDDIILPILAKFNVFVVAIDRLIRSGKPYVNVTYRMMEFLDIDIAERYDMVLFSFALHENSSGIQKEMINLAKILSNKIVIIEPMPRIDVVGKAYEEKVRKISINKNYQKHYYNIEHWKQLINFDKEEDKDFFFERSNVQIKLKFNGKDVNICMQDILVLIKYER